MFETAYSTAKAFTHPILVSRRLGSGDVETSLGAYVVLNDEWALTAGHAMKLLADLDAEVTKSSEHTTKLAEIEADTSLEKAKRKKAIRKLAIEYDPKHLTTNFAPWLGVDGISIGTAHYDMEVDLAVFQYGNAPVKFGQPFPFLRDPDFRPGVSLMRYGFPFHAVKASFDDQTQSFKIEDGIPIPVFPIEGISTRQALGNDHKSYKRIMLETSSPGLKGQSGGPIVDRDGTVWGIQSRTTHLPLGFNPKIQQGNREVEEHQFLNLGMGADAETIKGFLSHHQIAFNTR